MTLAWPLGLVALAAVPLALAAHLVLRRRRARYAVRFTNLAVLAGVAAQRRSWWRRVVPPALFLAALAACAVALARPQVTRSAPREQATVMLTLDTSGSMRATDVEPTRLAAAQAAVRAFLDQLPKRFRVGMVAFSGEAQLVAPPTTDRQLVLSALGYLLPDRGTAIGDAIARSVEAARSATGPGPPPARASESPVAILLLSDGYQTAGVLQPLDAARRARAARIPIYTIALGTPSGTISFNYGGFERRIPVPPDPETLREIARLTDGQFFNVTDAGRLKRIYESLGHRVGRVPAKEEFTYAFAAAAAGLLIAAAAAGGLLGPRLP